MTRERGRELSLIVGLLASYQLNQHYSPRFLSANESIRLFATQALVDNRRFRIDEVLVEQRARNVDRAEFHGHAYLDKAPGLSLLAVPPYALGRVLGAPSDRAHVHVWLELLTRLLVGLPCALAAAATRRSVLALGGREGAALVAALALGAASPYALYATLFFGHALAAALASASLAVLVGRGRGADPASARSDADAPRSVRHGRALAAGVLAGAMVVVETPTAFLAAGLATLAFARGGMPALVRFAGGAAPFAVGQAAYNALLFGSPFTFAYAHKATASFREVVERGVFGLSWPRPEALAGLSFGMQRGLFVAAPAFLASALAGTRGRAALALAGIHVLALAGFTDWQAGDAYGPRHLVPALPMLAVALGLTWERATDVGRALIAFAIGVGAASAMLPSATFPYAPLAFEAPLYELAVPLARSGEFVPGAGAFGLLLGALALAAAIGRSHVLDGQRTLPARSLALALLGGLLLPLALPAHHAGDDARAYADVRCLLGHGPCGRAR